MIYSIIILWIEMVLSYIILEYIYMERDDRWVGNI